MVRVHAYTVDRCSVATLQGKSSAKLPSRIWARRSSSIPHPWVKNKFVWALVTSGSVGETTVTGSNRVCKVYLWWLIECIHICTQSTPSISALKYVRWSYPTKSWIPLRLLLHCERLVPWKELLYVVIGHKVLLSDSDVHFIYISNLKCRKY